MSLTVGAARRTHRDEIIRRYIASVRACICHDFVGILNVTSPTTVQFASYYVTVTCQCIAPSFYFAHLGLTDDFSNSGRNDHVEDSGSRRGHARRRRIDVRLRPAAAGRPGLRRLAPPG